MPYIESIFLWLGSNFNPGLYLLTSKIQGILWSAADVVLVLAVLKISDLARERCGMRRLAVLHWILWCSAMATPLLLLAGKPRHFFLLECVICGTQFLILLYVALKERERIMDQVMARMSAGTPARLPFPGKDRSTV